MNWQCHQLWDEKLRKTVEVKQPDTAPVQMFVDAIYHNGHYVQIRDGGAMQPGAKSPAGHAAPQFLPCRSALRREPTRRPCDAVAVLRRKYSSPHGRITRVLHVKYCSNQGRITRVLDVKYSSD